MKIVRGLALALLIGSGASSTDADAAAWPKTMTISYCNTSYPCLPANTGHFYINSNRTFFDDYQYTGTVSYNPRQALVQEGMQHLEPRPDPVGVGHPVSTTRVRRRQTSSGAGGPPTPHVPRPLHPSMSPSSSPDPLGVLASAQRCPSRADHAARGRGARRARRLPTGAAHESRLLLPRVTARSRTIAAGVSALGHHAARRTRSFARRPREHVRPNLREMHLWPRSA